MSVALELEHALGFSSSLQGLAVHPGDFAADILAMDDHGNAISPAGMTPPASSGRTAAAAAGSSSLACTVMYGCGKLLVVSDLQDCHRQRLLRGHDAPVTCVDISPSGRGVASGQRASIDSTVSFIVWDFSTGQAKQRVVTPHRDYLEVVKFSPDEGMIVTSGAEGMMCVWDSVTGTKVASFQDTVSGDNLRALSWGPVLNPGTRTQQYTIYGAFNTGVRMFQLAFSVRTLNFELTCTPCQVPGAGGRMGGFLRRYLSCAQGPNGDLLCGTTSGDVLVFNSQAATYRTALTLCANGVTAICVSNKYNCVCVAGGDGTVSKIGGAERQWAIYAKTQLPGHISTMVISKDEDQLVAMTDSGTLIRILVADLSFVVAAEAPLGGLTDVCIPQNRPDIFASSSNDGRVRVWDLSSYQIIAQFGMPGAIADAPVPTSVCFDEGSSTLLVSGWSDGRIRGVDVSGYQGQVAWTIPNGHRGKVHTVRVCSKFILTAGEDACLRLWSRNRELVSQTQDHKLPLTSALIDNSTLNIVHSVSLDMSLASYDLTKANPHRNVSAPQRIDMKNFPTSGGFTCMAQRRNCEHEVIVGTVEGNILFFDLDYADPVLIIADKRRCRVSALEVSPNGRWLVAGLADGSIAVYELAEADAKKVDLVLLAPCHSSTVARVVWTADGRQLVSAGGDGELIVWNFYTADGS